MAKHDRIKAKLINEPWLIEESWLQTLVSIVDSGGDFEALQAKRDNHLDHTEKASVRGSVAIIPLSGPIFPKANLMTDMSGATSLESFIQDFQAADDNPEITTIVQVIDSPGGVVTGIAEGANFIRNAKTKTISFVTGAGASAAYWLGSASDEMVIAPTALVGSIGVVSAYQKDDDDDVIEFVNSASPNKRLDPESKEGKSQIIARLDDLAEVFIEDVAIQRDVSKSVVKESFGKGGVLVGQKAVDAGMADRIGTLEGLLTELTLNGDSNMDLKTLKADHKEVYDAAVKIGHDTATDESKEAIAALETQKSELEAENAAKDDTIAASGETIKNFEKQEAIRIEKDAAEKKVAASKEADAIVSTQLSASVVPERLHAKIAGYIDSSSHITDGALDVEGFTKAVDAEIADWAGSFSGQVDGFGAAGSEANNNSNDETESDATVARMLGHVNQSIN